jgi:hypothetical protein
MRRLRPYTVTTRARSFFAWNEALWTGELVNEPDLREGPLPWGLVEQGRIFEEVLPQLARTLVEEGSIAGALIESEEDRQPPLCTESAQEALRQEQLYNLRKWMQRKGVNSRVGGKYFRLAGTSYSEFCVGAKFAYHHLAHLWNTKDSDFEGEDLTTPMLATLLAQAQNSCYEEHCQQPNLEIQQPHRPECTSAGVEVDYHPLMAAVIKAEIEEGRSHKRGQILGMWDADEIKSQLMGGFKGPEVELVENMHQAQRSRDHDEDKHKGKPRRLVAHTLFLVRERDSLAPFGLEGGNGVDPQLRRRQRGGRRGGWGSAMADWTPDKAEAMGEEGGEHIEPLPLQCHVWEFETDLVDGGVAESRWRVRNINRAIQPRDGVLLESDGIGERRTGNWDY